MVVVPGSRRPKRCQIRNHFAHLIPIELSKVDEAAFLTPEEKARNSVFQSVGMQGLVNAVRATGAKNIIVAGGIGYAGDLSGAVNGYALAGKQFEMKRMR